jgi:hypothetical protein
MSKTTRNFFLARRCFRQRAASGIAAHIFDRARRIKERGSASEVRMMKLAVACPPIAA